MKTKNEFTVLIERDEDGMLIATATALKAAIPRRRLCRFY